MTDHLCKILLRLTAVLALATPLGSAAEDFAGMVAIGETNCTAWHAPWNALIRCVAPSAQGTPALPKEYTSRNIEGWNVRIDECLDTGGRVVKGSEALSVIQAKRVNMTTVVPETQLKKFKQITIELGFDFGGLHSMQHCRSVKWLKSNGFQVQHMTCVHTPNLKRLSDSTEVRRNSWQVLHELYHGYHDRVRAEDEPHGNAARIEFCESGRYKFVLNSAGERKQEEPKIYALMAKIWAKLP